MILSRDELKPYLHWQVTQVTASYYDFDIIESILRTRFLCPRRQPLPFCIGVYLALQLRPTDDLG